MKVQVLMSVYGDNPYLKQQLSSIYSQQGAQVELLVRDDGSVQGALHDTLNEEQRCGRLTWYAGANCGPALSFWNLLLHSPQSDYYAFSDQDDVWLPDKLKVAIESLAKTSEPALYFSQTQLTDEGLNPLPNVRISPQLTFGEALVCQFVGGNTMVFNHALRKRLIQFTPAFMRMHDVWIYDVALAIGAKIVFDPTPHLLYRQHAHNAVGQSSSLRFQWRARMERLHKERHIRSRLAEQLLAGYSSQMLPEHLEMAQIAANARYCWRDRIRLCCQKRFLSFNASVNISYRIAALLGLF